MKKVLVVVAAVAWEMPLPAPAWLDELQARDNVRNPEARHTVTEWTRRIPGVVDPKPGLDAVRRPAG